MESTHFKAAELRCHHCGCEGVRRELLDVLESLRANAGPLKVNSAYRCAQHPIEARKPKPGRHARGIAVDLAPLGISLRSFYEIVREEIRVKGIGVNHADGYIHVDIRESAKPVLWVYNNGVPVVTANPFQEVLNA